MKRYLQTGMEQICAIKVRCFLLRIHGENTAVCICSAVRRSKVIISFTVIATGAGNFERYVPNRGKNDRSQQQKKSEPER